MRNLVAAIFTAACVSQLDGVPSATADILVNISKSSQKMSVTVDGQPRHVWTISTGKRGYSTPNGVYQPVRLERHWYSRKYDRAPMPHSIFFHHGYAVHGTTEVARLGRAVSHGCVRLHPQNAATLFSLVRSQMANTRIVVGDVPLPRMKSPRDRAPEARLSERGSAAASRAYAAASAALPETALPDLRREDFGPVKIVR